MSCKYSYINIIKSSFGFLSSSFKIYALRLVLLGVFQLLGLFIALAPALALSYGSGSIGLVLAGAVIGLIIFCSAFYKNLLLNFEIMLAAKKYDEKNYIGSTDDIVSQVKTREKSYIKALLWICLYSLVAILPLVLCVFARPLVFILIFPILIFLLRISLALQIFVYEDIAPKDVVKCSLDLTKGHFFSTVLFWLIVFVIQNVPVQLLSLLSPVFAILQVFLVPFGIYAALLWYKKLNNQ